MAYTQDLKSCSGFRLRVQIPPLAPAFIGLWEYHSLPPCKRSAVLCALKGNGVVIE